MSAKDGVRKVVVLGASGSIGRQTIDVIERNPDHFSLVGAVVNQNAAFIDEVITQHPQCKGVVMQGASTYPVGEAAVDELIAESACDVVVNGIVGAAGLVPTLTAITLNKTVLLANKEPLVMAGELVRSRLAVSEGVILPIDSEHNAIFQCLPTSWQGDNARMHLDSEAQVRRILLTGSGGAFRNRPLNTFDSISVADATTHPNWSMGPKVTIDSATMMNKGLEYIEACVLFGVSDKKMEVAIHPQSIVHSMVEFCDGSMLAQLGSPDMRIPIANALNWPYRRASGAPSLDFSAMTLDFHEVDYNRYPCLQLAIEAARGSTIERVALNAANEIAVEAFIQGDLAFSSIATVVAAVLERAAGMAFSRAQAEQLDEIIAADELCRQWAHQRIDKNAA